MTPEQERDMRARLPEYARNLPIQGAEHANEAASTAGTRDGTTSADHDEPFTFGQRIGTSRPGPFTTGQLARMLIRRDHAAAARIGSWSVELAS